MLAERTALAETNAAKVTALQRSLAQVEGSNKQLTLELELQRTSTAARISDSERLATEATRGQARVEEELHKALAERGAERDVSSELRRQVEALRQEKTDLKERLRDAASDSRLLALSQDNAALAAAVADGRAQLKASQQQLKAFQEEAERKQDEMKQNVARAVREAAAEAALRTAAEWKGRAQAEVTAISHRAKEASKGMEAERERWRQRELQLQHDCRTDVVRLEAGMESSKVEAQDPCFPLSFVSQQLICALILVCYTGVVPSVMLATPCVCAVSFFCHLFHLAPRGKMVLSPPTLSSACRERSSASHWITVA